MGAFWGSWALWEKLCFALASGIVIVLVLGSMKLAYNTWRIRKYAKIRADTLALKRELRHSASVKRGRATQVPFGIRALEKGVKVEGVWHSRANTPTPSQPSSPILNAADQIEQHHAQKPSITSTAPSPDPIPKDFRAPSSAASTQKPPSTRQSYKPRRSSGLRFSNAHEYSSPTPSLTSRAPSRQSLNPSADSTSSSPASVSPVSTPPNPIYSIPHANLSSESNPFLTPTTTRKSLDTDIEHVPLHQLSNLVPSDVGIMSQSAYHSQILNAASIAYQDDHARPILMQEPHQLHRGAAFSFEDLHDPSPRHFDTHPATFHSEPQYQAYSPLPPLLSSATQAAQPALQQARPIATQTPTTTSRPPSILNQAKTPSRPPSFTADKRNSNVIRKINSGFEILRPGTLDPSARKSGEWLSDRDGKREKRGRLVKKKGRDSLV